MASWRHETALVLPALPSKVQSKLSLFSNLSVMFLAGLALFNPYLVLFKTVVSSGSCHFLRTTGHSMS